MRASPIQCFPIKPTDVSPKGSSVKVRRARVKIINPERVSLRTLFKDVHRLEPANYGHKSEKVTHLLPHGLYGPDSFMATTEMVKSSFQRAQGNDEKFLG